MELARPSECSGVVGDICVCCVQAADVRPSHLQIAPHEAHHRHLHEKQPHQPHSDNKKRRPITKNGKDPRPSKIHGQGHPVRLPPSLHPRPVNLQQPLKPILHNPHALIPARPQPIQPSLPISPLEKLHGLVPEHRLRVDRDDVLPQAYGCAGGEEGY